MSAKLLGAAFDARMASPAQKLLLLKLVDCGHDDGSKIFPAVSTMARAAECSTRSVQRELKRFVRIGLLNIVQEGGKGPGATTEYKLDIGVLRRLVTDGWKAVAGTLDAEGDGEDDADDAKGDTVSPLDGRAKGDTGDTPRVTPATEKGDTRSHPTPYYPSTDPSAEREGAGARADEADPDRLAVEREEASVRETMDGLAKAWPNMATDNRELAERAVRALSPEQRQQAVAGVAAFVPFYRAQKPGKSLPYLHNYLRDRRWEHLPERSAAAAQAVDVTALQARTAGYLSRAWWWLFWHRLERLGAAAGRRAIGTGQSTGVVLADAGELPPDSEIAAGMAQIDPGGAQWQAWQRHAAARGIQYLPRPSDAGKPVWAPMSWPAGMQAGDEFDGLGGAG